MGRGIHRFVIGIGEDLVKIRAQSATRTNQPFTVGSVKTSVVGAGKAGQKTAIGQGIRGFYPKASPTNS